MTETTTQDATVPPPRIFTAPEQSEKTVEIMRALVVLDDSLINMPSVKTEKEAKLVGEYRAQGTKKKNELDAERLAMTKPLRDMQAMLNTKYNDIIDRAKRAVALADNLLRPWMLEQERLRKEAEAKAEAEREATEKAEKEQREATEQAERLAQETTDAAALKEAEGKVEKARAGLDEISRRPARLATPARTLEATLGSKVAINKVWKYRVVDITKVPEKYLVDPADRIRKGDLNKLAKSEKEKASVPGIEFYSEDSMSSSAAKI